MRYATAILIVLAVLLMGAQIASQVVRTQSSVAECTTTYTDGGGDDGEAALFTFTPTSRVIVHTIWIDASAATQDAALNCYYKADGTNSVLFESYDHSAGVSPNLIEITGPFGIDDELICKWNEGADEGADRDFDYQLIYSYIQ